MKVLTVKICRCEKLSYSDIFCRLCILSLLKIKTETMSKIAHIQRYLLIIRKVRHTKFVTLNELVDYIEEEFTKRGIETVGLSKRTIERDLKDIRTDLDISIDYDRINKGFFIPENEESKSFIEKVLEPFDILNALNADTAHPAFIFPEKGTQKGVEYLSDLIFAIQNSQVVSFKYAPYWNEETNLKTIIPFALKEYAGRWYLVGRYENDSRILTFGLDRITQFLDEKRTFKPEPTFKIETYFKDSFGIYSDTSYALEEVVFSVSEFVGRFLISKPLHQSQQILENSKEGVRVFLRVRITPDFISELLSMCQTLVIHKPLSLKEEIRRIYSDAIQRNL